MGCRRSVSWSTTPADTALLLGHNPLAVAPRSPRSLYTARITGACHALELRWGQLVQHHPRGAACDSPARHRSHALALRLARAFTVAPRSYATWGIFTAGTTTAGLRRRLAFDGTPSTRACSMKWRKTSVSRAPPGDIAATAELLRRGDVAAVIIEPTAASWDKCRCCPISARARELADRHNVADLRRSDYRFSLFARRKLQGPRWASRPI